MEDLETFFRMTPQSCHSTLRKSEENHGLRVVRSLGTPVHQQKSLQSMTFFNSKRAGSATPKRLRKKSISDSPASTPSRKSIFTKRFKNQYPLSIVKHLENLTV